MITGKDSNFVSAVVYIHNNEKELHFFCPALYEVLSQNFKNFEIIFVNDLSIDGSVELINSFSQKAEYGVFSLVNMSVYQGVEMSMNAGLDLAIGDFVFEFDSPFVDYEIVKVFEAYTHLLKGFDIVFVSPNKYSGFRSWFFYSVFNHYSRSQYRLRSDRFRILSRRAINRTKSINMKIPYRKAVYVQCGLKIGTEVYEQLAKVKARKNKKAYDYNKNTAIDSLILFTDVAYYLSFTMTLLLLFVALGTAVYTVSIYFGDHKPVPGWTTTMLFMSFGFFGVFMMMAVIVKYLSVISGLIFRKQEYLIESIQKLSR